MSDPSESDVAPLVELRQISKAYRLGRKGFLGLGRMRTVQALRDVSLALRGGEVLGLVGESGSGKSTLGRIAAGLEEQSAGEVLFSGRTLTGDRGRARRRRLLSIQMIFQNAIASLNPRQRVRDIIAEPIRVHHRETGDINASVRELAQRVGIGANLIDRYPHEMSGGQCQRVGIARALAVQPKLLVCDEPVSALDVSIQAQILNLFADLKEQAGYTYLFISHDLHVVQLLSDRVAIMYLGRIVELGPTKAIYDNPRHPYTRALLDSTPRLGGKHREIPILQGEIPSPVDPPSGCAFHPRCPVAMQSCLTIEPAEMPVGRGHWAACHLHGRGEPPAADPAAITESP